MASDSSSPPPLDPGGSGDDGFTGGITLQTGDVVALFIACLLIVVAAVISTYAYALNAAERTARERAIKQRKAQIQAVQENAGRSSPARAQAQTQAQARAQTQTKESATIDDEPTPPPEVTVSKAKDNKFNVTSRAYIRADKDHVYRLLTKAELKNWSSTIENVKEVDRDGNVSVNTQSAVWRIRILWAEFKGLVPMSMRNVEHASKRAVEQLLVDGGGKIRSLEAKWRVEDDPARPGVCIAHCSQNVTLRLAFFPSPVRGIAARVLRANTLTVMRELKGAAECKKLM